MRSSYTFDPLATSFSLLKKTKKFLFFSFKISRGHLPSVSAPKCGLICQKFLSKDVAFDEGHLQEERQPFLKNYWRLFLCIQRLTQASKGGTICLYCWIKLTEGPCLELWPLGQGMIFLYKLMRQTLRFYLYFL